MKWKEIERIHIIRRIRVKDGLDKDNKEIWREVDLCYYPAGNELYVTNKFNRNKEMESNINIRLM